MNLNGCILLGLLIGGVVGAFGAFRAMPGRRSYSFGQRLGAAISGLMMIGALLGFIVGKLLGLK